MRQSLRRAARPAFLQPCSYIGQCEATQGGCRKLAEIGVQPRSAAAMTPLEKGATTVTTIGGGGFWDRLTEAPPPGALSGGGPGVAFHKLPWACWRRPPHPRFRPQAVRPANNAGGAVFA